MGTETISLSLADPDGEHKPPRSAAPSLDAIGTQSGTDKAVGHHGYLDFYERFFRDFRREPICLLEIGVALGGSLKMWNEYFPRGRIIGIDINPEVVKFERERITIEIADQSNVAHLVELGVRYGPFDVILDDGSHMWNHQKTSLQYLYPFVRPGGFYVMEDVHTSFGNYIEQYSGTATVSAFQYLNKMVEYTVADVELDIAAEDDSFIRTFARATEFVAFHRRTALLRRCVLKEPDRLWHPSSLFPGAPLVAEPGADRQTNRVPAWLTVHIGGSGDVTSRQLAGGKRGDPGHTIQGFLVHLSRGDAQDLQYRALSNDHVWTEWASSGTYVGTRLEGVAIRGFAVRLGGVLAGQFDCTVVGSFVDHPELISASAGGECRAPNGGHLEAMQIMLHPRDRTAA